MNDKQCLKLFAKGPFQAKYNGEIIIINRLEWVPFIEGFWLHLYVNNHDWFSSENLEEIKTND